MGTWLFPRTSKPEQPPATRLRIQSSIQGVVRPIVYGQTRIAGNLIDYLDFKSTQVATGGGGGKGGSAGVGGKGGGSQTVYNVTPVIGLCEGPITSVTAIWQSKNFVAGSDGYTIHTGSYSQTPDAYLTSAHLSHALNYRGLAYALFPNLGLNTSPELPQINFEILSSVSSAYAATNSNTPPDIVKNLYNVSGYPTLLQGSQQISAIWAVTDANPRDVIVDFLTNAHYGVAWPASRLDSVMNDYSSACLALGLVISPALVEPKDAASFLQEIAEATNAGFRWSNGKLTLVPWYDQPITSGMNSNVTETHTIPSPPSGQPKVQVGVGSFVANIRVQRTGGGTILTQLAFSSFGTILATNQYYVSSNGLYTFAIADAGVSVDITYTSAAQASFQPFNTPIYDLSDFLPNEGSAGAASGNQPIVAVRKPTYYQYNIVKLEWLDRNNNYDPSVMEVKDQAAIDAFLRRSRDIKQTHMFCLGAAATMSATLQLQREKIPNIYTFTVGPQFILLEVEDIVTLTRAVMGLNKQPVRIIEIQENNSDTLTITAEEFMGTVGPPLYNAQFSGGSTANYNASPGNINTPWIFEPTDQLGGGLSIWGAVSGVNVGVWGGCHVWASYDNVNYAQIGTINGPARMGVTTSAIPAVLPNLTGQTIDNASVLGVDLTESGGTLLSASFADFTAFNSKCWVGATAGISMPGEVIAYETATLTATNKYNLTILNRGGYGSTIAAHPSGVPFARLDSGIFSFPFDQSRIGSTVFFKFQSFNVYGGGLQDLSTIGAQSYVIQGAALASPLPNVTNVRAYFEAGFMKIYWDEISDFRSGIFYEVRKGASFSSALIVGASIAHPPFVAFGNDTFWIRATCQPAAGLLVFSPIPASISIQGNALTPNIVKTWDEQATGWLGGQQGIVKVGSDPTAVLDSALQQPVGIYEVPTSHIIDIGYVTAVAMNAAWVGTGAPIGQNILSIADFLSQPDILSAGSSVFVDVHLEIATALTTGIVRPGGTGPYSSGGRGQQIAVHGDTGGGGGFSADHGAFNESPIVTRTPPETTQEEWGTFIPVTTQLWGPWQKFVPGRYLGRYFKMRAVLTTFNPGQVQAILLSFSWSAIVDARIDHYTVTTSAAGDTTITFQPDGAAVAGAFNFGPNGSVTPYVSIIILNPVSGDIYVQTSISLSQLVFSIQNGGVRVARNVNVDAEGA